MQINCNIIYIVKNQSKIIFDDIKKIYSDTGRNKRLLCLPRYCLIAHIFYVVMKLQGFQEASVITLKVTTGRTKGMQQKRKEKSSFTLQNSPLTRTEKRTPKVSSFQKNQNFPTFYYFLALHINGKKKYQESKLTFPIHSRLSSESKLKYRYTWSNIQESRPNETDDTKLKFCNANTSPVLSLRLQNENSLQFYKSHPIYCTKC